MSEANRDEWQDWRTDTAIWCDSQKRLMASYVLSDLRIINHCEYELIILIFVLLLF